MDEKKIESIDDSIRNAVDIVYLNGGNTEFYRKGDFPAAKITKDGVQEDVGRVIFHRMFPFSELWRDISVQNPDGEEFGLIADVADFGEEDAAMIREELEKKYFIPVIREIREVKEKFGFSSWKVLTDLGEMSFTVRDTYRSMIFAGEGRIIINDSDGNRFEIPDVDKLDRRSYRKIELYI